MYAIKVSLFNGLEIWHTLNNHIDHLPGKNEELFKSFAEAKKHKDAMQESIKGGNVEIIRIDKTPRKFVITRHSGTKKWLQMTQGYSDAEFIEHIDEDFIKILQEGDVVIGNLPYYLAAKVCARGAKLLVVEFDLPQDLRGKELSAQDLNEIGAKLVEYVVVRKG